MQKVEGFSSPFIRSSETRLNSGFLVALVRSRDPSLEMLLMSMDEWESWEETFEVLQDEELLDALKRSEGDVKAGRLVELDDVLRRHGRA
jgi:PHD/YefM family antitoxin component YafN of YafNO toxin-antitoxin module